MPRGQAFLTCAIAIGVLTSVAWVDDALAQTVPSPATQINASAQLQALPTGQGTGPSRSRCVDPVAERADDLTLRVGRGWSATAPCQFRWGEQAVSYSAPLTVRLAPGTALADLRVAAGRDGLVVTVEGAATDAQAAQWVQVADAPGAVTVRTGSAFPLAVIPLFEWRVTGGVLAPSGMPLLTSNTQLTIGVSWGTFGAYGPSGPLQVFTDTAYLSYPTRAPLQAGPCKWEGTGAWATDANFLYVCVSDGHNGFQWGRVALSSW